MLDGVGAGEAPDCAEYRDAGSNTLGNVAKAVGGLHLPNMESLGLGRILRIEGVDPVKSPRGSFGLMKEASAGKDTITGHWELAGIRLSRPFRTYPYGFPPDVIQEFERAIGTRTLGNKVASGTEIIKELGEEHLATGYPIVYTSTDSVFQIAAHRARVPVPRLYEFCEAARRIMVGDHLVARIIARPFDGEPGRFWRTPERKDFSVEPASPTVLDCASIWGKTVLGIGKIHDIFAGRGITHSVHTSNNAEGISAVLDALAGRLGAWDIVFANLVDFDMVFGHRNDPAGFARALVEFDSSLSTILEALAPRDLLVLTADHGCDPTTPSTDHSREVVPLLVYGKQLRGGVCLGMRQTLADVAESVADHLSLRCEKFGTSFMPLVRR